MRYSFHCALMAFALTAPAVAKLPPLSDEAKAKAAETAAKTAWADKVSLYKHCLVTDRIANTYRKTGAAAPASIATATAASVSTAAGAAPSGPAATATAVSAPIAIPACADPGPFVAPVLAAAKPPDVAGAQSPPGTKPTAAELSANPKASPVTATKDKPIEASEAHSPTGTAVSPPSTNATAAETMGKSKK